MSVAGLPSELLIAIFKECVALAHDQDRCAWQFHFCETSCLLYWINVTYVCRHWRAVALECPALWTRPVIALPRRAAEMLSRAGSSHVQVSAHLRFQNKDAVELVLASTGCTDELVLDVDFESLTAVIKELVKQGRANQSREACLEALSLRCTPGFWPPISETQLVDTSRLKRLHLDSPSFDIDSCFLEGMSALEELALCSALAQIKGIEDRRLEMPCLKRLHVMDSIYQCQRLLFSLRLTRPLDSFGLDDAYRSTPPRPFLSASRELFVTHHSITGLADGTALDLSGYHSVLCLGTPRFRNDSTNLYLAAWPQNRATMSASRLVSLAHASKLTPSPPLSSPAFDANLTTPFLEPPPSIYMGSAFRGEAINIVAELSHTFSLRSVVHLDIQQSGQRFPDFSYATLSAIFSSIPSLISLKASHINLVWLVDALLPPKGSPADDVPVPLLEVLSLPDVDFAPFGQPHVDSLASCIVARAAQGCILQRLTVERCMNIGPEAWPTLEALPLVLEPRELQPTN